MRDSVQKVLSDAKINDKTQKSTFWLLASTLHKYLETYQQLPLSGKLPDMTSTTDFYITLQTM